jgi:hypothetical protein
MFVSTRYIGLCPFSGTVLPEDSYSSLCVTASLPMEEGRCSAGKRSAHRAPSSGVGDWLRDILSR